MLTLRHPVSLLLVIVCSLTFSLLSGCGSTTPRVCAATGCCGAADVCVAPTYLIADGINGQVSVFPVGQNGTLSTPLTVSGPAQSLGMTQLGNQFVYAANPVPLSGSVIDGWSMEPGTGQLVPLNGSPFTIGLFSVAGGLAANTAAQVVYVADAGKVDALASNSMGALTVLPGSPYAAGAGLGVAVDPGSRFVYSTDTAPPGNVWAFTADSAGVLTPAPGSPYAVGVNPLSSAAPSQVAVDLFGKFVFVTLTATNQVAAFSIDQSSGALTPVPGSPFAAGSNPIGIATTNNLLYVSNTTDGTVSGYTFDTTSGVLTPALGSPFPISAGALTTAIGANFLYASTAQGIATYSINSATGALTQSGTPVSSPGASVLTFVF